MPGWHQEEACEKSTNTVTPSPDGATVCKGKARTHTTLQAAREVAHEAPRAHRVVSLEKSVRGVAPRAGVTAYDRSRFSLHGNMTEVNFFDFFGRGAPLSLHCQK